MTRWLARAKAQILPMGTGATDITDESPLVSVSSLPTGAIYRFPDRLSSVSSVGVRAVFENTALASDLIEAAMRVCNAHGDNEAARTEMRQQCMDLPPELQADLLDHFRSAYPIYSPQKGEQP